MVGEILMEEDKMKLLFIFHEIFNDERKLYFGLLLSTNL